MTTMISADTAIMVMALFFILFSIGCGAFGYFLGWRAGEAEGFEAGKSYQRMKRAGEDVRDHNAFGFISEN